MGTDSGVSGLGKKLHSVLVTSREEDEDWPSSNKKSGFVWLNVTKVPHPHGQPTVSVKRELTLTGPSRDDLWSWESRGANREQS